MRFTASHEPCGTEVETELPPGYPVAEGVGLWCPTCDQSFWHVPAPGAPTPTAELGPNRGGYRPTDSAQVPAAPAPEPAAVPARSRWSWRFAAPLAAVLLLIAAVAVIVAGSGDEAGERGAAPTTAPTASPAAATPTPTPTAQPAITPLEAGEHPVEIAIAGDWTSTLKAGDPVIRAPDGSGRITISERAKRGRSLARLGRDARRSLRADLPRHRISRLARLELNGRRALRVTARRGADAREVTVLAVGDQRFVIVLEFGRDAPRAVRREGRLIADSVTIL